MRAWGVAGNSLLGEKIFLRKSCGKNCLIKRGNIGYFLRIFPGMIGYPKYQNIMGYDILIMTMESGISLMV